MTARRHDPALEALLAEVVDLKSHVEHEGAALAARLGLPADAPPELANLTAYLALRHRDLRPLQRRLMAHGLSSLGRMESRVVPTLDAVIHALACLAGLPSPVEAPAEADFFAGETRPDLATDMLFGPPRADRRVRIMVTLPSEAADDPGLALRLAEAGMDVGRINCAHDRPDDWIRMAENLRAAGLRTGRPLRILMDVAGPKIRTESVAAQDRKARMGVNDRLLLVAGGEPDVDDHVPFAASVSLPEIVRRLRVGDRVRYDDGKVEGVVTERHQDRALVRLTRVKTGGARLKPEKGLNLPDTALGLSPLTAKDRGDLDAIVELADMVGYSFVSEPDDIDLLEEALASRAPRDRPLALVAKIERPEAIANLPALIARALPRRPFGVMIARGDLAAEIGFERLAEMQEEILWICEAAQVPVIWATQVLEDLVKDGVPSRGEMTDAAMAVRAECVMLNKGPEVMAAVELLGRLMARMGHHLSKKTPRLRALRSW